MTDRRPRPIKQLRTGGLRRGFTLCGSLCDSTHMATNLAIDPRLLERALEVSGERTKTAAVTRALEEYVARHEQRRITDLFGSLEWDTRYDYKGGRARG